MVRFEIIYWAVLTVCNYINNIHSFDDFTHFLHTRLPKTEQAELTSILWGILIFVYCVVTFLYPSSVSLFYVCKFLSHVNFMHPKEILFRVSFVIIMCSRFLWLLFFTGRNKFLQFNEDTWHYSDLQKEIKMVWL